MKRSFTSSLAVLALIAGSAIACSVCTAFGRAAEFAVRAYTRAKSWVLDGFALAATSSGKRMPVPVPLIQAKAFVLRLAKRDRPVVTSSWRMCPST